MKEINLKMKAITSTTFRKEMKKMLDLVTDSFETLVIPRNNGEDEGVVIMPLSEYNSLIETNYLTATLNNKKRLEQAIDDVENDNTVTVEI